MSLTKSLILISLCLCSFIAKAEGYSYEHRKVAPHSIHIVTIDPKVYKPELIKAKNTVFARETVLDMAKANDAVIGINAGFFLMDEDKDGQPTGTLVIGDNLYGLKQSTYDYLLINPSHKIEIKKLALKLDFKIGNQVYHPLRINNFLFGNETALYTDVFGETTLTPINRQEIIINKDMIVTSISNKGNNLIPEGGYVLSFGHNPANLKVGDKAQLLISMNPPTSMASSTSTTLPTPLNISAVTGIPMLIHHGVITEKVLTGDNGFYTKPHARTAIGVKKDGQIVLVVAGNIYSPSLKDLTFDKLSAFFGKNKKIDKQGIQQDAIGLTMKELAKLMLSLGCYDAINLDGGGSSTLYLEGKVVNSPIGDEDEGLGQALIRPVSNAIIFKKIQPQ